MGNLHNYALRLDNSICDIFRFKNPSGIYEMDGVTPKSDAWLEKVFPYLYGVTYCHINPSEAEANRLLYVYVDADKPSHEIGKHEIDISNFDITPKTLWNLFKAGGYKQKIAVANLTNLEYVCPNIVKRDKILNDGKTYCLVRDLQNSGLPPEMMNSLKEYDFADKTTGFVPQEKVNLGWVTGVDLTSLYPIKVEFPNGYKAAFIAADLMLYHEI